MSIPQAEPLSIRGGETVRVGLQLKRPDGTHEDLTGRVFAWALVDASGETADVADGAVALYRGVSTAIMTLTGTQSAALLTGRGAAARFSGRIVEPVAAGVRPHCELDLILSAGADPDALPDPGAGGTDLELITLVCE